MNLLSSLFFSFLSGSSIFNSTIQTISSYLSNFVLKQLHLCRLSDTLISSHVRSGHSQPNKSEHLEGGCQLHPAHTLHLWPVVVLKISLLGGTSFVVLKQQQEKKNEKENIFKQYQPFTRFLSTAYILHINEASSELSLPLSLRGGMPLILHPVSLSLAHDRLLSAHRYDWQI